MRTYLIKYSFLLFAVFAISSCSGDPWTSEQKSNFLENCEEEGGSPGYCDCFLDKTMDRYPRYNEALKMSFEEAVDISFECE